MVSSSKRRRRRSGGKWYVWVLVLLALLAAGAAAFLHYYLIVGGQVFRKDAETLDLRSSAVSAAEYDALREKLPDAQILWSVPFGGGRYDSSAESITLTGFDSAELPNLRYLENLRAVDAEKVNLTPEQFDSLQSALPEAEIRWAIPIGGAFYPSYEAGITLGDFTAEEIGLFRYFDRLERIDARSCTTLDALMALREAYPALEIEWNVPLGGSVYAQDTDAVTVDGSSLAAAELDRALAYLPAMREVTVPGCAWSGEERAALSEKYPYVRFRWPVTVCGKTFQGDETEISFAGRKLSSTDLQEMAAWLPYVSALRTLDLTGCGLDFDAARPLYEALPGVDIVWDFELYGVPINSMDTFIDFSKIEMDSTQPVEDLLPFLPHMEKVDMSDCGFTDEEMDALNKRYEDVRFVWTIHIIYYKIRTDAIGFRASSNRYSDFNDETIHKLDYCEDMIALDLGHRYVPTLDFVYHMPNLKYLVLMDCKASDLTPLASCDKLIWLELNQATVTDISPLKECHALTDLNIVYNSYLDQEITFKTVLDMPWLERLWYSYGEFTNEQLVEIQKNNPNLLLHMMVNGNACEDPWRFDADYYDMRDAMNMFYMDENYRINYKIIDGVRYELDPEFIANQGDTSHDRDRG